ncbi:TRAP transporter small permease [Congregibacter litoralis]|uniref:TRAP transporter small permease protein n=1 Tax=Congregibacter litoralis KT71 TaxID=314285 RepID=A4AC71_9GAMM|nr:TRAP transporter small permease [Congregibacter litoralis]EAQ96299.1 TRAP-type C4-dicarboxylate transport system, small permease component [Congregibacter litoralis KT71]
MMPAAFYGKLLLALESGLRWLLIMLMAALVMAVSWQVLSRYVLTQPSSWTEEASRFLLVWLSVLGATYAYRGRMHLAIDLLPRKLGSLGRARLEVFNAAMVAIFAMAAMVYGGGYLVMMTWELKQTTPALGIPMAMIYLVLPVSGVLLTLFAALRIGEEIQAQTTAQRG